MSILEFEFLILTELNFVSTFVNYRQIQLGLEEISGNVHFVLKPWQVDLQRFKLTFYHTLDKNHFLVKNVTILVRLKVILLGMRRKYTKINQTDWVFWRDDYYFPFLICRPSCLNRKLILNLLNGPVLFATKLENHKLQLKNTFWNILEKNHLLVNCVIMSLTAKTNSQGILTLTVLKNLLLVIFVNLLQVVKINWKIILKDCIHP